MNIVIRTASTADLPALRRVYRDASLSNKGDRAQLLANPAVLIHDGAGVQGGRTRVATVGDVVVGFATLSGTAPVMELEDLFTAPQWMRRGVARALMSDAREIAARAGADRVDVVANPHAMTFYLAVGFTQHGDVQTTFGVGERLQLLV